MHATLLCWDPDPRKQQSMRNLIQGRILCMSASSMLRKAQLTADARVITCAGVAALADGVNEGTHTVVVDVALAGAIDGRLLTVQVRVQPQLSQGQHACSRNKFQPNG